MNRILMFSFILALAVWQDMRERRVDNRLILMGLSLGLIHRLHLHESFNFFSIILDAGLPVIFLFPLFLTRILGAGDVKLFSVAGIFIGACPTGYVAVLSLWFGGFFGLFEAVRKKNIKTKICFTVPMLYAAVFVEMGEAALVSAW